MDTKKGNEDACALKYWNHRANIYSQNGEDGIIAHLLSKLKITDGWVCEFGAADGQWLSNTWNLVKTGRFQAVYIEADEKKFTPLKALAANSTYKITAFNRKVSSEKDHPDSLDKILALTKIPTDFDLLSIDVDSYDYTIWANTTQYRPKIVIIEINSGVLPHVPDFITHGKDGCEGTSYLPTVKLGLAKGYRLVCHVGNLIWIRNDLAHLLDMSTADPLLYPACYFLTDWLPHHLRGEIQQHQHKICQ